MTIQPGKDWYIRALVIWSQALQLLLSLLAPRRKTTDNRWVLGFISMVFYLSNLVPAFTLVIICSRLSFVDGYTGNYQPPLLVWASFMLLHLAGLGQERESAFPLSKSHLDKEWHQVLVEFVFYEVFVFGFLLFMCWKDESYLAFINICLAYRATFSKLKSLNGVTSHQLLICGNGLSLEELNTSRADFFEKPNEDAIRTTHEDFNLIYAKFYRWILISSYDAIMFPLLVTLICLIDIPEKTLPVVLLALISLFFFPNTSVVLRITVGGSGLLVLETVSQLLKIRPGLREADKIININLMFFTYLGAALLPDLVTRLERHLSNSWFRSGWCERVPTFNLLFYGLQKPTKLSAASNFLLNKWSMCHREKFTAELGGLILRELKLTSESKLRLESPRHKEKSIADDVKQASPSGSGSGSGSRSASDLFEAGPPPINVTEARRIISAKAQRVNDESPFEEIVLVWHIATGICRSKYRDASEHRSLSNLLSDYMGYLLIAQPWMMSKSRAYAYERSLQLWFHIKDRVNSSEIPVDEPEEDQVQKICQISIQKPEDKSVLRDAHDLAEKLKSKIPDEIEMWKVIGKVWVEMLAYAAIHAHPSDHIRSLSQGGELATVVWLWMAHLGLINNFYGEASSYGSRMSVLQSINQSIMAESSEVKKMVTLESKSIMAESSEETMVTLKSKSIMAESSEMKKMVTLKSSDGETFKVEETVALQSEFIKDKIGGGDTITISNVSAAILVKVIEYLKKHKEACNAEEIKDWDAEFVKVDQATLFDLIMAAKYLNIKSLIDLTCQTVADSIKGKTPEEITKILKIKKDFTPEEEAEARRENPWAYE